MKQTNFIAFAFTFLLALSLVMAASTPGDIVVSYLSPSPEDGSLVFSHLITLNSSISLDATQVADYYYEWELVDGTAMGSCGFDENPGVNSLACDLSGLEVGSYKSRAIVLLKDDSVFNGTWISFTIAEDNQIYYSSPTPMLNPSRMSSSPISDLFLNTTDVTFNSTIFLDADQVLDYAYEMYGAEGLYCTDKYSSVNSASCSLGPLSDGTYKVRASVLLEDGLVFNGTWISFTIDTIAPVISVPSNIEGIEATSASGAVVVYNANSTEGDVLCIPTSGSLFAVGTTLVTCSVTDAAGNTDLDTFNITVKDYVAPVETSTGGSGGGSGSCTTQWTCNEWSVCNAGSQTRTCTYPTNYCTPKSDKPLELRTCTVPATNTTNVTELESAENQPGFINTITGNVIGTTAGRWSLGILIFLILVGLAWWIVAAKKRRAEVKPAKKGKK